MRAHLRLLMKIPVAAAAVIVLTAATTGRPPSFSPLPTDADMYPRRIGIDVENYRFEISLRDDTDEIEGRATVSLHDERSDRTATRSH